MEERLQKILSAAGVCSRRQAETYLQAARVTVNGRPAGLGDKVDPERDVIALDGALVGKPKAFTYIMLHKPRGYVTTLSDDRGRPTVAQLIAGCPIRLWPVGRLDYDSEGLLLCTNDGALTQRLTHPSHQVEKEYLVRVSGDVDAALPILTAPMCLDGEPLAPAQVSRLSPDRLRVVIHQGKNRQVRRMCAAAGLEVLRLKRVREGSITLGNLPRGEWRFLTEHEIATLQAT